jgi:serine/threonine protein phosphatase PrpC
MIPHRDKRDRGGEDAFFLSKRAAGVFDGVGGWSALGIDPGLYSRRLAELMRAGTDSMDASSSLVGVLDRAVQTNEAVGSCTACVVALSTPVEASELDHQRGVLTCVNLGDSGMLVLRKGKVIFRSKEQQHYFNCPFQLGTQSKDTPYDAFVDRLDVQAGDWLVLGTDGLFDNVFDAEIVDCIRNWCRERAEKRAPVTSTPPPARSETVSAMTSSLKSEADGQTVREMHTSADLEQQTAAPVLLTDGAPVLQELAQRLAEMAVTYADDENRMSPFALNARNAGFWYYGGKLDDVTVIVGRVSRAST